MMRLARERTRLTHVLRNDDLRNGDLRSVYTLIRHVHESISLQFGEANGDEKATICLAIMCIYSYFRKKETPLPFPHSDNRKQLPQLEIQPLVTRESYHSHEDCSYTENGTSSMTV